MRRILFTSFFLIATWSLSGQQPSMIIEIHGQVAEVGTQDPVASLPLHIEHFGKLATDDFGSFNVPVPYASGIVKINIEHPGYEILNPPEGAKVLSQEIEPNSVVNIHIWVLGAERNEALVQQVKEAEKLVAQLEKKNELSQLQIQDINQRLLDTINAFEIEKKAFTSNINQLQQKFDNIESANNDLKSEIRMLNNDLLELRKENEGLLIRLAEALEERYLKQNSYFKNITNSLNTYVSRLKDFRDHLNRVDFVFKNRGAMNEFNKSLSNYNVIYEELNGAQDEFSEAVGHYWESTELAGEFDELVQFILSDIHQKEVLSLNDSVLLSIQKASSGGARKPKKTKKDAARAVVQINQKIELLDSRTELFVKRLSDF